MKIAELVYLLCAGTSLFCAFLLFRSHRAQPNRLLFWSTVCFLGLTANSIVLVIDLAVVPEMDLRLLRTSIAFVAMSVFVIALVWESK